MPPPDPPHDPAIIPPGQPLIDPPDPHDPAIEPGRPDKPWIEPPDPDGSPTPAEPPKPFVET
jgi:hypothetical protein